jgi:hypothetical protein
MTALASALTSTALARSRPEKLHKDTQIKVVGRTVRIYVPDMWETQGSGYVANAPLEGLSTILKLKPQCTKFRVTWRGYPPGDTMSGTALYNRSEGTVELFSKHSSPEGSAHNHFRYSRVTDTILHKIARLHSSMPKDGYEVETSAYFRELAGQGCPERKLP